MRDTIPLALGTLIVTSVGAGIGVLVSMARLLGEARATTREVRQIMGRVTHSDERIADMTRTV